MKPLKTNYLQICINLQQIEKERKLLSYFCEANIILLIATDKESPISLVNINPSLKNKNIRKLNKKCIKYDISCPSRIYSRRARMV